MYQKIKLCWTQKVLIDSDGPCENLILFSEYITEILQDFLGIQ